MHRGEKKKKRRKPFLGEKEREKRGGRREGGKKGGKGGREYRPGTDWFCWGGKEGKKIMSLERGRKRRRESYLLFEKGPGRKGEPVSPWRGRKEREGERHLYRGRVTVEGKGKREEILVSSRPRKGKKKGRGDPFFNVVKKKQAEGFLRRRGKKRRKRNTPPWEKGGGGKSVESVQVLPKKRARKVQSKR